MEVRDAHFGLLYFLILISVGELFRIKFPVLLLDNLASALDHLLVQLALPNMAES